MSWNNSNSKINTTKPLLSHISYNCSELGIMRGWMVVSNSKRGGHFLKCKSMVTAQSVEERQSQQHAAACFTIRAFLPLTVLPPPCTLSSLLGLAGWLVAVKFILREFTEKTLFLEEIQRLCTTLPILLHNITFS